MAAMCHGYEEQADTNINVQTYVQRWRLELAQFVGLDDIDALIRARMGLSQWCRVWSREQ